MMKSRKKRLIFVVIGLVGVGLAGWLILTALQSNLNYFYSPKEIVAGKTTKGKIIPKGELMRIGGMVEEGSLVRKDGELALSFVVTDMEAKVTVRYNGILPDLFKDGSGTVVKGRLQEDGVFLAEEVLAKHDEDYIPPEIAESMKAMKEAKAAEKGGATIDDKEQAK